MADGVDLSRVEQQLRDISARVDEYAGQFLALQTATARGRADCRNSKRRSSGRAMPLQGQHIRDGKGADPREPEKSVVG